MRTMIILFALAVVASPVMAQTGPDTIGLWFDPDYTVNVFDPGVAPFQGYLVLHNPTAASLTEMEFSLQWPTVLFVLDAEWPGDPVVFGSYECLLAAYPTPLPLLESTLLATFQLMLPSVISDGLVTVGACNGNPCPYYRDPSGQQHCLDSTLGGGIVACLGDCSVGNQATSWSSVKSLYR